MNTSAKKIIKISYPLCNKGGYHEGEFTNIVCLEPKCQDKQICCSICIDSEHVGHKTKPLRIIINEIQDRCDQIGQTNIDQAQLTVDLSNNKQLVVNDFKKIRQEIVDKIGELESKYDKFFEKLQSELSDQQNSSDIANQILSDLNQKELSLDSLKDGLNKLMELFPQEAIDQSIGGGEQTKFIQENLKKNTQAIVKDNESIQKKMSELLDSQIEQLTKKIEQKNVLSFKKISFVFSDFKHQNIIKVSDTIVKSGGTQAGYKFAIMEPSIQDFGNQKKIFAFKMKEVNSSNWIAVGICHRQIIIDKNYAFSFNALGHGSYLISSNGGTWSNTNADLNNVVKAFKFQKNDIVICEYDPSAPHLLFKKKKNNTYETHKLDLKFIDGDLLYPCVLFYYLSDEVEFLNDFKE